MTGLHHDPAGTQLTNEVIVRRLQDETLDELMGLCHMEPAEPEICICCAAHEEACRREETKRWKKPVSNEKPIQEIGE